MREACLPRSASRKHISVTNQDKIEDEDNDVSFERDRVKDLAGKTDSEVRVFILQKVRCLLCFLGQFSLSTLKLS